MVYTEVLIIFLLILVNAFFAMSEMAIVSSSRPFLKQMAKQGDKKAEIVLRLLDDYGRFLSTVQVGVTLIATLAGTYGGAIFAEPLAEPLNRISWINPHGYGVAIILVVASITYFNVVLGELVPKQFALNNSEKIAKFTAPVMLWISRIFSPLVKLLEISAHIIMALMGILKNSEDLVTENEVKAVVAEGAESGAIEKSEFDMFQRIIRLGDRDVKSIMTHRVDVKFIDIKDSLEEIRKKVHEAGHSRYPVIDGDENKVVGVVQAKELLDGILTSGNLNIDSYVKDAYILPETATCLKALEMFKSSAVHLAIVVDEYGATEGLITAADILEAIVGVLPSNYEEGGEAMIVTRRDGSWLVDGLTPIEEIHFELGIEQIETSSDYETIAGFILQNLGANPHEGAAIEKFGYRFEIIDMDNRRIDKILIEKLPS